MTKQKPPELPAFAAKLRELCTARGLSLYQLAKRTGLTLPTVSNLAGGSELGEQREAKRIDPGWRTVQLIALALDVTPEVFRDPELKLPEVEAKPRGRPKGGTEQG